MIRTIDEQCDETKSPNTSEFTSLVNHGDSLIADVILLNSWLFLELERTMGFDISYSTTERISPTLQREIMEEANALYSQYSWVNVMGPSLQDEGGYLIGDS